MSDIFKKFKFSYEADVMADKFIIIPMVSILIGFKFEQGIFLVLGFANFTIMTGIVKK